MENKREKIRKLKEKIKELQKIYKRDVCESFREAQQTQDMIEQLNKQLEYLKIESTSVVNRRTFELTSGKKKRQITVAENADPVNNIISKDSPVGKLLISIKIGDIIKIGEREWKVEASSK